MSTRTFATTVLHPGQARAPVLVLDEALSFWGGFDPVSGTVIDRYHPQRGECVTGKVLALPGSRGSAGTPAGVAEAIRRGAGPLAILLSTPDVNITIGAMVAERLYGNAVPVVVVTGRDFNSLATGDKVSIAADGMVKVVNKSCLR